MGEARPPRTLQESLDREHPPVGLNLDAQVSLLTSSTTEGEEVLADRGFTSKENHFAASFGASRGECGDQRLHRTI